MIHYGRWRAIDKIDILICPRTGSRARIRPGACVIANKPSRDIFGEPLQGQLISSFRYEDSSVRSVPYFCTQNLDNVGLSCSTNIR